MANYRNGVLSASPANGAAYWTFNTPTRRAWIRELNVTLLTTVLSQVELGVPANEATPPVVSTSVTPEGATADIAATGRVGTAWSTAPTAPTTFRPGTTLAAVIGSAFVFAYPEKLADEVKIAGWRTLWNRGGSTAGQLLVNIVYDE
jgi:hypothetical protein